MLIIVINYDITLYEYNIRLNNTYKAYYYIFLHIGNITITILSYYYCYYYYYNSYRIHVYADLLDLNNRERAANKKIITIIHTII